MKRVERERERKNLRRERQNLEEENFMREKI